MRVIINGKEEMLEEEISILDLLKKKNIRPEVVTVELNEHIVERNKYSEVIVKEGDRIEFVFFMGGGN